MRKIRFRLYLCLCALLLGTVLFPVGVKADKQYTVTFYDRNGKKISPQKLAGRENPVQVTAGKKIILESLPGSSKETFLGWSLKPGKMTAPQFCAYYGKPVRGNLKIYAVTYPLSKEQDLTKITALNTTKYTKAIFVGDSRIARTYRALKSQKGLAPAKVEFVAASNYNLQQYRMYLESKLIASVKKSNKPKGSPIAVVFAMGVNDLKHLDGRSEARAVAGTYASYLKKLAKKLREID